MASRTFRDPDGRVWEAWDVYPGQHTSDAHEASRHLLGRMADGWLCFRRQDEKRRLTPVPAGWQDREDAELWELCGQARPVALRKPQPG
jgi:hypothetical protein